MSHEFRLEHIQLKMLAESLNIQPPSLYNHISGLNDLHHELMLYGRKNMEERMVEAAAGTSGYAAWEALRGGFYAYATALPPACSALCSGIASTRTMSCLLYTSPSPRD